MRRTRSTHLRRTRLKARLTLPEFQDCSDRLEMSGQSNITTRLQVNREIRGAASNANLLTNRAWTYRIPDDNPSFIPG
jgi:hypothetical protein